MMYFFILFLSYLFAQPKPEVDIEKYFENVSSQERAYYVAQAEVMNDKWSAAEIQSLDVLDALSKTCKMEYKRDVHGLPVLPTVECDYQPKSNQHGMTSKFRCTIDTNGKKKTHKIKYSFKQPTDTKEIPQAIISASLARMMGFYANTYCPAVVKCRGCSSDPWKLQNRSSTAAIPGTQQVFNNAVVEFKVKGDEITVPTPPEEERPLGFKWEELQTTLKNIPTEQNAALRIEREALMMFMSFIYHTDADPHNNKLVCAESAVVDNKPKCLKVVAYTSDWGDSFKKMDFNFYSRYQILSRSCNGGLDRPSGLISNPKISEEARVLFLDRLDRISDQQLSDLFELAQIQKFYGNPNDWIRSIRAKADSMRQKKCAPFKLQSDSRSRIQRLIF